VVNVEIQLDQYSIDELTIRAPFDGVVTESFTAKNKYEIASQKLLQFISNKDKRLDIAVPNKYASRLARGTTVRVASRFGEFTTQIKAIIPKVNPDTLMFYVRVSLPENSWLSGEVLQVNILPAR
jgi:multidrug efflux pump subunit AcrA (membrane-fusion protein)